MDNKCILFIGEGNFSYSASYIQQLKSLNSDHYFIASDLKDSKSNLNLDKSTQLNISIIEQHNGKVFLDIDATAIELHHEIARLIEEGILFSKIIFNFPFKCFRRDALTQTKKLLKNFFVSSSNIVSIYKTEVQVTLCSGQSGLPFESRQRASANTFKIVEMAAYGDFVLTNVEPFKHINGYVSGGYSQTDSRSFHTEDAFTYTFIKRESIKCHLNLNHGSKNDYNLITSNDSNCIKKLYNMLLENSGDLNVFCNQINDFNLLNHINGIFYPISHQMEIANCDMNRLINIFNMTFGGEISLNRDNNLLYINEVRVGQIMVDNVSLQLDRIALIYYQILDPRIFWSKYCVSGDSESTTVSTKSFYPPEYEHHLSFWILNMETWDEEKFLNCLFNNLGFIIKSINLIDTFEHIDGLIAKTYKINHQSVDLSLSKLASNELQNRLRDQLERALNIKIR